MGGFFYSDPADPRIFVPKVTGLGWTVNLAHPWSWVILAALAALIIIGTIQRRNRK